jgi:hypothetical protein
MGGPFQRFRTVLKPLAHVRFRRGRTEPRRERPSPSLGDGNTWLVKPPEPDIAH